MIIHADMDAFYASVELLDKPQLIGQPVAVGGPSRSRGVIAAANYVARSFGVHSALPCAIATRRCPDLVLIKPRISHYAEYSRKIKAIFYRYTPIIEPLALDEAFLDASASEKLFGSSEQIARKIKQDIKNELKLPVSIGVAPNKFIAKIASDIQKPDGFVVVTESKIQDFLDPLPVTRIWGIGKVTAAELHEKGIHFVKDLRQLSVLDLQNWFGKNGQHLWELAHGIDDRKVVTDSQAKSISHETTFDINLGNMDAIMSTLLHLTEQVSARLRNADLKGRTITIKIRNAKFETITRSQTIDRPTDSTDRIWQVVKETLLPKAQLHNQSIRLLGVGVSHFNEEQPANLDQLDLFSAESDNEVLAKSSIDKLTDNINQRFGGRTLVRGKTVKAPK